MSVVFKHMHTSFCLIKYWLGDHLSQILFNEKKLNLRYPRVIRLLQLEDKNSASSTYKVNGIK